MATIEQLLETARPILDRVPRDQVTAAWLSGSLVEGLGNPSSDFDLFVAVRELSPTLPVTRRDRDHAVYGIIVDGRRFDIEYWTEAQIAALAHKLEHVPVDDLQHHTLHFFEYWETEFIHRIFIGAPAIAPEEFARLRALFDRRRFAGYLTENAIRRVDDAFDDAVGMLDAGDLENAILRARDTVELSIDVLLYAHGETNDKTKFRVTKLRRAAERHPELGPYLGRLWDFECGAPRELGAARAYVEQGLRWSSDIVEGIQRTMLGY